MRRRPISRTTCAFLIAVVVAWIMPARVPVAAQQACAAAYQTATSAIAAAATGQGVLMKLTTKVANAWRMFQDGHRDNSLKELDVALKMLEGEPTKQISDATRAQVAAAITAFRECLVAGQPPSMATLTVRTFLLDDTLPDGKGESAGAGVYIRIDGATIGQTGDDGTLTAQVPAATILVQGIVPSTSIGQATVTLAPGTSGEVSLVLDDGKEVVEDTDLVLQELADGVVPSTFASFTMRFDRGGTAVALETIDLIELLDRNGDIITDLNPLFALTGGVMTATNLASLRSTLQQQAANPIAIRAQGVDAQGFTHAGTVRFRFGVVRLVGALVPPPSNPALPVAGIEVRVTLLGTPVVFTRVSDADGRFEIASVPIGNVGFDSQTQQNGQFYYGQGTLFLTSNRSVSVVMRHVSDVIAGVPPLSSGPIVASVALAAEPDPDLDPEIAQARLDADAGAAAAAAVSAQAIIQATTASINVAAGPQNVPITQSATLDVPRGTKTVKLVYSVFSLEYPFWVLQQSIFNDVWSLSVFGGAGGQQLFQITRNVNSQVSTPPIWQGNSSTGQITETLNVEALAANADTTLTLSGSSMNVGDSALTTIVSAQLTAEADLTINAVEPDTVNPTRGDSSFYSIPRAGDMNVFERWFTLRITKPDQAPITQVRVILRGAGDLQTIYEEAPGPNVQIVDNERLRVRVSYQTVASTVNSIPPPIHQITYRFRVQADYNGQTLEDERDSGIRRGLWRMPNGFPRYGGVPRDPGLDDWASRGTYLWMQANAGLLTRIDDISGEHARDIGHTTHERGVDIDEFHYYTFPGGAVSGGANYTQLTNNVFNALNGDAAAAGRVADWVTATRNGLAALHADNRVNRLYYAIGNAGQRQVAPLQVIRLNGGWARALIRDGTFTAASGQVLNTGLGVWALAGSQRITYNAIHNSHIHIALNSALLPN
ncbi:MAG TPA: carboxypeptidase-like regulatory domain-containing protein [Vicinamibacterales bacterium]|nr:carboxypeptidase-like regulatory domain-containing protein [Vicinamibacterales bacterium]